MKDSYGFTPKGNEFSRKEKMVKKWLGSSWNEPGLNRGSYVKYGVIIRLDGLREPVGTPSE